MPTMMNPVDTLIARMPPANQVIAHALRELIRKVAPKLGEAVKWGNPCYIGSGNVCAIVSYKSHVNLAFFRGSELPDPKGVLEGTGKDMRHVRVESVEAMPRSAMVAMIKAAVALDARK